MRKSQSFLCFCLFFLFGFISVSQATVMTVTNNTDSVNGDTSSPENLINNPELGERIGKNAYEFVKGDLSWKLYAENMMYVFKKARAEFKK